MDISIFEVLGPVMVGPSSSHTAGAAKLARISRLILNRPFNHVSFGLHGSFAKTYLGHGTDKALVAGALGIREDDEQIVQAFELARERDITYNFYEVDLDRRHENSVLITFLLENNESYFLIGSSIGGGQVVISNINGFETEFTAQSSALIISHLDHKGVISEITKVLVAHDINIGVMKLSRTIKGEIASCIIETDTPIVIGVVELLEKFEDIISVKAINL